MKHWFTEKNMALYLNKFNYKTFLKDEQSTSANAVNYVGSPITCQLQ